MHPKIIESMLRHGIGLDPWFFEKHADAPNFPPHNIVQYDENRFELTLAVAGFLPEEMHIVQEGDILTITGRKGDDDTRSAGQTLYRGIAFRDFERQFKIGDHVYVRDVSLRHGLLVIALVRELPDAQKPRVIKIT